MALLLTLLPVLALRTSALTAGVTRLFLADFNAVAIEFDRPLKSTTVTKDTFVIDIYTDAAMTQLEETVPIAAVYTFQRDFYTFYTYDVLEFEGKYMALRTVKDTVQLADGTPFPALTKEPIHIPAACIDVTTSLDGSAVLLEFDGPLSADLPSRMVINAAFPYDQEEGTLLFAHNSTSISFVAGSGNKIVEVKLDKPILPREDAVDYVTITCLMPEDGYFVDAEGYDAVFFTDYPVTVLSSPDKFAEKAAINGVPVKSTSRAGVCSIDLTGAKLSDFPALDASGGFNFELFAPQSLNGNAMGYLTVYCFEEDIHTIEIIAEEGFFAKLACNKVILTNNAEMGFVLLPGLTKTIPSGSNNQIKFTYSAKNGANTVKIDDKRKASADELNGWRAPIIGLYIREDDIDWDTVTDYTQLHVAKVDAKGKKTIIPRSYMTQPTAVVMAPGFGTYQIVQREPKYFEDLPEWAFWNVLDLSARAVVNGTNAYTFAPDRRVTRGEFTHMLMAAIAPTESTAGVSQFSDVKSSDFFANSVLKARKLNVIGGTGDNKFQPNAYISRQDMLTMLLRAANTRIELPYDRGSDASASFSDADQIATYARNAMNIMVQNGIVTGHKGKLSPKASATRAEAAVVIDRLLITDFYNYVFKYYPDDLGIDSGDQLEIAPTRKYTLQSLQQLHENNRPAPQMMPREVQQMLEATAQG